MLSLSLRVVCFTLAILGVPATWLVFIPFASAIGASWAPILYCVTVSALEIVFSLGMIWRMNPSNMPQWFCVIQTVIIGLCFHLLTGICGCFTWASYLTVFKPYRSIQASASALLWRRAHYLFVVVVPLLTFTAFLVAVLKTDSVHPVSDLHCDVTSPLWPRLLGYAGAPIILYTPCFILSIVTAARILRMYAEIRERRVGESDQSRSTRVINIGSRMNTSGQSTMPVSSVSDKLPSPTLGGRTGVTIDLQLHGSLTRSSSRVSVHLTPETIATNSYTHFPIELPTLPPMSFPSAYLSQPSPPSSTKDLSFSDVDVDRGQTPSPIVFARAPVPFSQHYPQLDAAGQPCDNVFASSGCDPERVLPPHPTVSKEPPASPTSPSRAPISLEVGERMPRFHLPTRSPPSGLRPSLELSPEYSLTRLEADRVTLTRCLENLPSSPCSSHRRLISSLASGEGLGYFPNSTYVDRALEGLPEDDGADKGSIMKGGDDFVDECEMVSPDSLEPPLKPVRQFYRSPPRLFVGRPPGLHPAIISMVVFQLVFFFILILASLSTVIDLIRDRAIPSTFGTQHVAILLVAWCPAIVFGYLPGVRNPFLPQHFRA
ncbi:hypothetical protein DFH94DRAFT_741603 [Russula ochroleuca]|uniref:Uncharacterized protein n=1 Tax=Russula ochroleuca TaxID=152965 RepID=A0A9P5MWC6_9AGAM|nr:hypothetical protein DFH94DRAFT_741603 [Russula ochroleuca]